MNIENSSRWKSVRGVGEKRRRGARRGRRLSPSSKAADRSQLMFIKLTISTGIRSRSINAVVYTPLSCSVRRVTKVFIGKTWTRVHVEIFNQTTASDIDSWLSQPTRMG
ncbi:hypothetical protein EVAR_87831_1 [Eumeta japonica]|uniref:Uncharacterized protein n=1 Tax=Eumeta variegata TaxID=151549 RepID=A0A4C1YHR1_EUMVA|nr:hypothetical protein EVAR_87831_1 [Eumeta japonica]